MSKRIPLRARDGSVRAYAIVDDADYGWVSQWRWQLTPSGYVTRCIYWSENGRKGRRTLFMHRELLGITAIPARVIEVDHRNRNPLDNRRSNLRRCSRSENQQNVPAQTGSASRFRGVAWHKATGKWQARVILGQKQHYLGVFATEEEAAEVAAAFRREYMPFSVADLKAAA